MQLPRITNRDIEAILEAQNNLSRIPLTPFQDEICKFFSYTKDASVTSKYLDQEDKRKFNNIFKEHCCEPCRLKNSSNCFLHNMTILYCLTSHIQNRTDYRKCPICSSIGTEKLLNKYQLLVHQHFAKLSKHLSECSGCWKCCTASRHRNNPNYSSLGQMQMNNTEGRDEYQNSDFVKLPQGIFYTDEGKEDDKHHGYLRLIPVSLENEVEECADYKDLIEELNNTPSYISSHRFECNQIQDEENRYRHLIDQRDISMLLEGKQMTERAYECFSLALKDYLSRIIQQCKNEHYKHNDSDNVITLEDVKAVASQSYL